MEKSAITIGMEVIFNGITYVVDALRGREALLSRCVNGRYHYSGRLDIALLRPAPVEA